MIVYGGITVSNRYAVQEYLQHQTTDEAVTATDDILKWERR